jgi:hypothetical protein
VFNIYGLPGSGTAEHQHDARFQANCGTGGKPQDSMTGSRPTMTVELILFPFHPKRGAYASAGMGKLQELAAERKFPGDRYQAIATFID